MMDKSIGHGIHASAHDGSDRQGPLASRAVRLYLATQAESGHLCPITMTHACIGALRAEPALLNEVAAQNPDRAPTTPGRCRGWRRTASRSAWA